MGKIIFRTKSKELKEKLSVNNINYIDYVSSKSIKFGSSGIKYPDFNLDELIISFFFKTWGV